MNHLISQIYIFFESPFFLVTFDIVYNSVFKNTFLVTLFILDSVQL